MFTAKIDSTPVFTVTAVEVGSYPDFTLVEMDATSFADTGSHTVRFEVNTTGQVVNFNLDDVNLCQTSTKTYLPVILR